MSTPDETSDLERVTTEPDPVRRARMAGELAKVYRQKAVEMARIRKLAINEAGETHGSFSAVAAQLGLTRGRISQIRRDAPPDQRAFFGVGPVTVAFPLRKMPGRSLPVVSSEDELAQRRLTKLLEALKFEVDAFPIPPNGEWNPPSGDVVAICGPVNSPVTAEALTSDPFLVFNQETTSKLWTIRTQEGTERFVSPLDLSNWEQSSDFAYVGRLPYRNRTLLIIAGIHSLGSVGAVDYLTEHVDRIYDEVGNQHFSMVVRSDHDGETVTRSELAWPPQVHP